MKGRARMSKELSPLKSLNEIRIYVCADDYAKDIFDKDFNNIESALKDCEELKWAVNNLAKNHIELVKTKGGFYFKIKNSKGKEKSWTSLIDFWKQWFEIKEKTK